WWAMPPAPREWRSTCCSGASMLLDFPFLLFRSERRASGLRFLRPTPLTISRARPHCFAKPQTMSPENRETRGQPPRSPISALIEAFPAAEYRNLNVLLIVPDGTRTAPIGLIFRTLHGQIGGVSKSFDILIALGTHQPMSEAAIRQ